MIGTVDPYLFKLYLSNTEDLFLQYKGNPINSALTGRLHLPIACQNLLSLLQHTY